MMDKLTTSLSETIEHSTLKGIGSDTEDILLETGENIIDKSVTLLEEIPILKTLRTLPKIYQGISNYLLIKKIVKFLTQLQSISIEQRKRFIRDLESNKKKDIIENLMLVIEKHDDYKKSELQGKIFKVYVLGDISHQEYESLTYATSMMNLQSLERLVNFYKNIKPGYSPEMSAELLYYFAFLQLITVDNSSIGTWGGGGPQFKHNELGKKYVEILIT